MIMAERADHSINQSNDQTPSSLDEDQFSFTDIEQRFASTSSTGLDLNKNDDETDKAVHNVAGLKS